MPREINFVAERRKIISKTQLRDRLWFKWASWALGVTGLIVVATVVVFVVLTYQSNQVKAEEETIRSQITSNQNNEAALVVYVRKLAALTQVYQDRQDKNNIISYFASILGVRATIVGITFDQINKLLQFQIQSDNIFSLRQVLDVLNSDDVKAKYPTVSFSKLTRDDTAKYNLTVSVPIR